MFLFEALLVKDSCGLESFTLTIRKSNNLITTLHPYIRGRPSLKEPSPSPIKVAPKKIPMHSRPAKKGDQTVRVRRGDDDTRGRLVIWYSLSDQNKIRGEIIQEKLVRKGWVFNFPITHIHRPPLDEKSGRQPLEIKEPHKPHVQNLKKKKKINPHGTVVPFILMFYPEKFSCLEDFDLRKHD